jgi:hypothetical protein
MKSVTHATKLFYVHTYSMYLRSTQMHMLSIFFCLSIMVWKNKKQYWLLWFMANRKCYGIYFKHLAWCLLCINQSMPSIKPCSVSIILNRSVTECYKAFLCTCTHQVPAKHTDTRFINLCLPFNNGVAK